MLIANRNCWRFAPIAALLLILATPAVLLAFGDQGCGAGACTDCHSLTPEQAKALLPPGVDQIHRVVPAEVGGLWQIEGESQGQRFAVWVDFSGHYLIAGNIIRLKDGADISKRVELAELQALPAVRLGAAAAPVVVEVLTDVHCQHCRTLHQQMQQVVQQRPEVAFRIHLLPLMMTSAEAAALQQANSLEALERAYRQEEMELPSADTAAVEALKDYARRWQLRGTPALVLPDGLVLSGARPAARLIEALQPFLPAP